MGTNRLYSKCTKKIVYALIFIIVFESIPLTILAYKDENGMLLSGSPVDGRIYTICSPFEADVNYHYRVLDIEQPREYWSNVSTYMSTGIDWQEWEFINFGTYWKIKSLKRDSSNNRDNYLSVAGDSPNIGANAWVWYDCSGTGQRFKIVNVEGTQYFQFLTACSNYTLALGVNTATHNVEQMSKSSMYTYFRLYESGFDHGSIDGKAYIQEQLSGYSSTGARFLGRTTTNILGMHMFSNANSKGYLDWNIEYAGHGYFNIFSSDNNTNWYLTNYCGSVEISDTCTEDELWKIEYDGSDDSYTIISKTAYEDGDDKYLGRTNADNIQLFSTDTQSSKWAICFSENDYQDNVGYEFDRYDVSLMATVDVGHSQSHGDIFNFAIQSTYLRENDIFNISYSVSTPLTVNAVKNALSNSRIFAIRTHGNTSGELVLKPNQASDLYFAKNNLPNDLSNLQIAMYSACYSAIGSYTNVNNNNLVYGTVERGAKCAIGFDGSVVCNDAHKFITRFFDYYSSNYGTPYITARWAFRYACTGETNRDGNGYDRSFKPFYDSYSRTIKYDASTNTIIEDTLSNHH